jgi:hypothetical protein
VLCVTVTSPGSDPPPAGGGGRTGGLVVSGGVVTGAGAGVVGGGGTLTGAPGLWGKGFAVTCPPDVLDGATLPTGSPDGGAEAV